MRRRYPAETRHELTAMPADAIVPLTPTLTHRFAEVMRDFTVKRRDAQSECQRDHVGTYAFGVLQSVAVWELAPESSNTLWTTQEPSTEATGLHLLKHAVPCEP